MNESIRLIKYDELDKLMTLYRFLHEEDPVVRDSDLLRKHWDSIFKDENLLYVVAEKGGTLVSSCTLTIIKNLTRGLKPYGLIENVITHPSFRNKGYGTKVLKEAVRLAGDRECYKVMLMTSSKKKETLEFYEKAGFEKDKKTAFIHSF